MKFDVLIRITTIFAANVENRIRLISHNVQANVLVSAHDDILQLHGTVTYSLTALLFQFSGSTKKCLVSAYDHIPQFHRHA